MSLWDLLGASGSFWEPLEILEPLREAVEAFRKLLEAFSEPSRGLWELPGTFWEPSESF